MINFSRGSVQFSSVTRSCPTSYDPTNCSTLGFPVLHYLPELSQAHVHGVSDVIQPSHPLLPLSLPALNLFQHQGLLKRLGQLLRKIPPFENWEWEKGIFLIHEKPCIQNIIEEILKETNLTPVSVTLWRKGRSGFRQLKP